MVNILVRWCLFNTISGKTAASSLRKKTLLQEDEIYSGELK